MSDFVVPDMIAPITAWRSWQLHTLGTSLYSHNDSVWKKKEAFVAVCGARHDRPTTGVEYGWELVHDRKGTVHWVRCLDEGERTSYNYHNREPQTYPVVPSFVSYSSSVMYAFSTTTENKEEEHPPALAIPDIWVPSGYSLRLGQREVTFPPYHGHAPDENCSCGVYALSTLEELLCHYPTDVVGEIYLWGKVVVGTSGYRAQYAYPKALYWRGRGEPPEYLSEYGVPVIKETRRKKTIRPYVSNYDMVIVGLLVLCAGGIIISLLVMLFQLVSMWI